MGGEGVKCVWFEAPIAQNPSGKSLINRYGAGFRADEEGQIAS